MRETEEQYRQLGLRAHSLLAGVPLHDVWMVELPGAEPDLTLPVLHEEIPPDRLVAGAFAVKFLFGLRASLGRVLRWDRQGPPAAASFLHRLTAEDHARSLRTPGTLEGPFRLLLVTPHEAIAEALNATVHAFLVFALAPGPGGHRLFWAVYVQPVGRITAWYMRLIDPFRRWIVYPTILRNLRQAWAQRALEISRPSAGGGSASREERFDGRP